MYNLIVVDDEANIRNGISKYVKSVFKDINIAATFVDGKDAVDFLKNNETDIIITDIKMSKTSGIELAHYIYTSKPHIKVIFISGYREFEYAKQAIDFNVQYFLSKPIDLAELKSAITEVIKIIDSENETRKISEQYKSLYSLAKSDFFTDILLGVITDDGQISEKASKIGITDDYLNNKCCVFNISLPDTSKWQRTKQNFYTLIQNSLRDFDKITEFALTLKNDYTLTIVAVSSEFAASSDMQLYLQSNLNHIKNIIQNISDIDIEFKIEFIGDSVISLIEFGKLKNKKTDYSLLVQYKCKELVTSVISKDFDEAVYILSTMKQYTSELDLENSKNLFVHFFTSIHKKLSVRIPLNLDINFGQLNSISSNQELFDWCDSTLNTLINYISTQTDDIELSTIQKVQNYISENYMYDITLDDIANHVYLNPSYLSRFFKNNTGVTLTDYLIETRMKKAISLLKTKKYKINEISKMCGYQNFKYFAKVFKKFSGYTPTEYINLILNRRENDV